MHNDIHCEDYFDPNNQPAESETISEADVSEGRGEKANYAWTVLAALVMIFISSYDTCGKPVFKNHNHFNEKK
jgi:hypothetical protein